jgi:hypothetical protein
MNLDTIFVACVVVALTAGFALIAGLGWLGAQFAYFRTQPDQAAFVPESPTELFRESLRSGYPMRWASLGYLAWIWTGQHKRVGDARLTRGVAIVRAISVITALTWILFLGALGSADWLAKALALR